MALTAERAAPVAAALDERRALAVILTLQLLFAGVLAAHNVDQMNPDGVGYCRTAEYLARGRFDIGVSGYFGVLISWLMVPGVLLGLPSWVAGRIVLVGFALLGTLGFRAVLKAMDLGEVTRVCLVFAGAMQLAGWSAFNISADVPLVAMSAWLYAALLSRRDRLGGVPMDVVVGALGAVCLFAKPIGLHLSVALILGTAGLRVLFGELDLRSAGARVGRSLGAMALTLSPWVLALSLHYGEPTLTRATKINRAMLHPNVTHVWNHPAFTHVHLPPEGMVSTWEDPTWDPEGLDLYGHIDWSPFDSRELFERQLGMSWLTFRRTGEALREVDGIGLALASVLLAPALALIRPRERRPWRDVWVAFPVALSCAAYMPFLVFPRYLWHVWVLVYATLGLLYERLVGDGGPPAARALVAAVCLGLPAIAGTTAAMDRLTDPPSVEMAVARRLADIARASGADGPVVSWTPYTAKGYDLEGMYAAWVLDRPWLGHISVDLERGAPRATRAEHEADEVRQLREAEALGARILVVKTALPDATFLDPEGDDRLPSTMTPERAVSPPAWLADQPHWRLAGVEEVRDGVIRGGRLHVYIRSPR